MKLALVGDIGGPTHALRCGKTTSCIRSAYWPRWTSSARKTPSGFTCTIQPAPGAVGSVCLSVAGPVSGDEFRFTNNHWRLSRSAFCQALQVDNLLLVNDFSAMALGMTRLQPEDVRQVCPGTPGPGTAGSGDWPGHRPWGGTRSTWGEQDGVAGGRGVTLIRP